MQNLNKIIPVFHLRLWTALCIFMCISMTLIMFGEGRPQESIWEKIFGILFFPCIFSGIGFLMLSSIEFISDTEFIYWTPLRGQRRISVYELKALSLKKETGSIIIIPYNHFVLRASFTNGTDIIMQQNIWRKKEIELFFSYLDKYKIVVAEKNQLSNTTGMREYNVRKNN